MRAGERETVHLGETLLACVWVEVNCAVYYTLKNGLSSKPSGSLSFSMCFPHREMAQLKLAEQIIAEKDHDLHAVGYRADMVAMEKEALEEEIARLKNSISHASIHDESGTPSRVSLKCVCVCVLLVISVSGDTAMAYPISCPGALVCAQLPILPTEVLIWRKQLSIVATNDLNCLPMCYFFPSLP